MIIYHLIVYHKSSFEEGIIHLYKDNKNKVSLSLREVEATYLEIKYNIFSLLKSNLIMKLSQIKLKIYVFESIRA